eukprot:TRINITY_DN14286_c0_g1_i1.p1 TRINITY_DN14286_c0_g1~~TRINITY_DN14286_c0_g1_i1.p1  ORF type:complete len:152 (-),score=20.60 TRINITY_DN14286_c0_g1_i1:90-545(-)
MNLGGYNKPTPLSISLQAYTRLFNHQTFLKTEQDLFVANFEDKRGDREIDNIFGIFERVSELRDHGIDRLEGQLKETSGSLTRNLNEAEELITRIQVSCQAENLNANAETARMREKERELFSQELQNWKDSIDDNYRRQEKLLMEKYKPLT